MTGAADPPGQENSPRELDALVPVLAAEFPVYVFGTLRTYNGVSLSARHKDGAAGTGVYAVITTDPGEMRRALGWQPMTAGRSAGPYPCPTAPVPADLLAFAAARDGGAGVRADP